MLQLLGDELIASDRLAVFELVKNAYDADATKVTVRLNLDSSEEPNIVVRDDGEGMTLDTIRSVWLVPGNEHRKRQREMGQRTPKHGRLPLGEKGLGRFAVHKLGNHIRLVTRARNSEECVVIIDWDKLIAHPYLDEAPVRIRLRHPRVFKGDSTGTQIRIKQLRTRHWRRGEVRRLHNQITSMCSPFEEPDSFAASLSVPDHERWLEGLPDVTSILDRAFWKFSFELQNGVFNWRYEFSRIPGLNLEARTKQKSGDRLHLQLQQPRSRNRQTDDIVADASTTEGVGPVRGELFAYDRDRKLLRNLPHQQMITRYLDEYGGVRVYRDGIRVYNYGEQGDDWLGLDLRRVNTPTRRISRNIVLGAIHLSLGDSMGLVEKTNREGFVDNDASRRLQRIVLSVIEKFEAERFTDKERIRLLDSPQGRRSSDGVDELIADVTRELRKHGIRDRSIDSSLRRVRRFHNEMQETLLSAGMSGLNLAVVFHEVERGVRVIHQALLRGVPAADLVEQARDLAQTLDGFSMLLRRSSKDVHSGRELIESVLQISSLRLDFHGIRVVCPALEDDDAGFHSQFAFNLVLGALSNLIDNAIYWLRVRHPQDDSNYYNVERKLYIDVCHEFEMGPAIVVADNGTGFRADDMEYITRPFFTHRPEGMGLGLYYTRLAMELQEGHLVFPQQGEIYVPDGFDGAVVALVFREDR